MEKEKAEKEAKEAAERGEDEPAPEKVRHSPVPCPLCYLFAPCLHPLYPL